MIKAGPSLKRFNYNFYVWINFQHFILEKSRGIISLIFSKGIPFKLDTENSGERPRYAERLYCLCSDTNCIGNDRMDNKFYCCKNDLSTSKSTKYYGI